MKSPSPNKTKEKIKKPSPSSSSSGGKKNYREREVKLKQRELLPLFDESTDVQYQNLLDGDASIEDELETKRVDPTSYSGKISHDSEDSKSGATSCETSTACNGEDLDNFDSSSTKDSINVIDDLTISSIKLSDEQDQYSNQTTELEDPKSKKETITDSEILCSEMGTEEKETKAEDTVVEQSSNLIEPNTVSSDEVVSLTEENMTLTKETVISDVAIESRSSSAEDAETRLDSTVEIKADPPASTRQTEEEIMELINQASTNDSSLRRADALESLLELCARLLKQDKFDELSGVLKPFGEETVSSRETAIWLTKTLMNAQKMAKDS